MELKRLEELGLSPTEQKHIVDRTMPFDLRPTQIMYDGRRVYSQNQIIGIINKLEKELYGRILYVEISGGKIFEGNYHVVGYTSSLENVNFSTEKPIDKSEVGKFIKTSMEYAGLIQPWYGRFLIQSRPFFSKLNS